MSSLEMDVACIDLASVNKPEFVTLGTGNKGKDWVNEGIKANKQLLALEYGKKAEDALEELIVE